MAGRTNGGDPTGLQFSLGSVSAFALKVAPETLARAIYELERSEWLVSHHVLAISPCATDPRRDRTYRGAEIQFPAEGALTAGFGETVTMGAMSIWPPPPSLAAVRAQRHSSSKWGSTPVTPVTSRTAAT